MHELVLHGCKSKNLKVQCRFHLPSSEHVSQPLGLGFQHWHKSVALELGFWHFGISGMLFCGSGICIYKGVRQQQGPITYSQDTVLVTGAPIQQTLEIHNLSTVKLRL